MFSGGLFQSMPGMRDALTKPEPPQEWLEAAQDRCQRRMHSTDTASLQAEIDQLRLYVAVLFRLLVARGAFTVEEAQRLAGELETASGEPGGAAGRDVVSGAELPPKENPFQELREVDGSHQRGWWPWVRFGVATACVLGLAACVAGLAWLIVWVRQP
jgi:hypothetical protein